MDSYCSTSTVTSFSNIVFVPLDEEDDDVIVTGRKNEDEAVESPRGKTKFSKKLRLRPPLLASTPRVICRFPQSNSVLPYFTREPQFQPMPEFIEMSDTFDNDATQNSQGYRHFNSKGTPFRQSTLHQTRRRSLDFVADWLKRIFVALRENLTGPTRNADRSSIETAREDEEHREHIDLSEIFKGHEDGEHAQLSPSGGVPNQNFTRSESEVDDVDVEDPDDVISFYSRRMTSFASDTTAPNADSPARQPNGGGDAKQRRKNDNGYSIYRSEEMKLFQMILVKEAAFECVAELGRHGNVQFVDLNAKLSLYSRTFVKQMRRCEEMERKLRFLERQVITCKPDIEPKSINFEDLTAPTQAETIQLEHRLDQLEKEFLDLNRNDTQLRRNLNSAKEFFQVMTLVDEFFHVHKDEDTKARLEKSATIEGDVEIFSKSFGFGNSGGLSRTADEVPMTPLLGSAENAWFVAGVLPLDKKGSFERVLWRACRRTAFVKTSETSFIINDPVTLEPIAKSVFIVFFKGDSLGMIVQKVCDGFNATQYPCPKTSKERKLKLAEMEGRMNDLTIVIDTTQTHRFNILKELSFEIPVWLKNIQIQKSVFAVMNMFTVDTNGFLAGECWVPADEEVNVRQALHDGFKASGTEVEPILNELYTNAPPPTFHRTNKFTSVFQGIVDSYGVSQYREVNPAPYTIITFPFLFAVMFGDAAHGFILLLFAIFFIKNEKKIESKKIKDEIFNTFFGGRYIMMLMGLFSIYTGCLYNDAFAKSFNVFGSGWGNPFNQTQLDWWLKRSARKHREFVLELVPETSFNIENTYPFGVDPIWNIADNRLNFLNSLKMKASVIIGIAQMTFGVFLSLLNHVHFKSYIDVLTNFIPQVIFLSAIFVYLCVQIVLKWIFFSVSPSNVFGFNFPGSHCAPSLLIGLINMFMFKKRAEGYRDKDGNVLRSCHLGYWYPQQRTVETVLLCIAMACVPIMLLGKPLWVKFITGKHRKANEARSVKSVKRNGASASVPTSPVLDRPPVSFEDAELLILDDLDVTPDAHHSLSDIFVHQAIHTIEFVLGCVSHTASYLRLWALSLAHAQLSEVMWHMVLMQGLHLADSLEDQSFGMVLRPIAAFLSFFIFAVLSLSILIMMEGLSAFLHALRLHWVEFQSKFYMGTGHPFHAFYLKESLENAQSVTEETDRMAEIVIGHQ